MCFKAMLMMATIKYKGMKAVWRLVLKFAACCFYLAYNLHNRYS